MAKDIKNEHSLAYDICLSLKKDKKHLFILNILQSIAIIILVLAIVLGGK